MHAYEHEGRAVVRYSAGFGCVVVCALVVVTIFKDVDRFKC